MQGRSYLKFGGSLLNLFYSYAKNLRWGSFLPSATAQVKEKPEGWEGLSTAVNTARIEQTLYLCPIHCIEDNVSVCSVFYGNVCTLADTIFLSIKPCWDVTWSSWVNYHSHLPLYSSFLLWDGCWHGWTWNQDSKWVLSPAREVQTAF